LLVLRGRHSAITALALGLAALSLPGGSLAQERSRSRSPDEADLPLIKARQGEQREQRISRVEVVSTEPLWVIPPVELSIKPGEPFTAGAARRSAHELVATGSVAEVTIETEPDGDGVVVRLLAVPQRVLAELRVQSDLDVTDALRSSGIDRGSAVTPPMLRQAERAILERARLRGYPAARVTIGSRATDDHRVILLLVEVIAGPPSRIAAVRTEVQGVALPPELRAAIASHGVSAGDRADDEDITERDRALAQRLKAAGYHRARVSHRLYEVEGSVYMQLEVTPGPLIRLRFEGNRALDADQLEDALDFEHDADRSAARAGQRVREEFARIGFLDAEVSVEVRGAPDDAINDMVVKVRENARVRVAARLYPCLTGERKPGDIGSEIDSFLEEELPGSTLLSPVDPATVDELLGPRGPTGARPAPLDLSPRSVFVRDIYDRALKHVQDLYRSEGYLSALVGPLQIVRRRCDPASPAGTCRPLAVPAVEARCATDLQGVPIEEPPLPPETFCRPNTLKGITCEPRLVLRIPVKQGPKAVLYDVVFEGAMAVPEPKLLEVSGLEPGAPASNVKIEEARRAILDHYKDNGYAFAQVAAQIELSPDKQRARVRFAVLERQRVVVDQIIVRGNHRTKESVIRARLRFRPGDYFQQREVRRSEELVATLGVFSSVTIALDDPSIPATHKVVVVTVAERDPQYLEFRPGVSTGEGVRGLLEYGHRNLGGQAIQLTLRVQLSFLPAFLIPDSQVRANFTKLPLGQRLERRNSVGLQFPNVFHPSVRVGADLIDVRSNSRDFGLTKDAILPAITWSPFRQLTGTLGASVELNDVGIFSGQTIERYLQQTGISNDLNRLLRVPDGQTTAVGQRVSVAWDRRDNPLGATRGTVFAGSVEHVHAYPAEDNANTITSDFLRFAGRAGGYVRLSKKGLALAMTLGAGFNRQLLSGSKTYPDRLFFLGGVDSVRGFTRDSLVPQDVADQLEADEKKSATDPTRLTIDKIAIRGGDVFLNPRAELRIPLSGPIETALFIDAGNVWVDPTRIEPLRMRYTGGSGLRFTTPIGPVALDYGVNLTRRIWEDFGAFHFSIGLF
jgi:outer membrane protein insertion porin family